MVWTRFAVSSVRAEKTLGRMFEAQVALTPGAVAVVWTGGSSTYDELNSRANQLARELVESGVGPERFVALLLSSPIETVVAALAVAKAGGAFVPIDPAYHPGRIAFMLADFAPTVILTTKDTAPLTVESLILDDPRVRAELGARPVHNLDDADLLAPVGERHLAYVEYTSGTTGRPKGVMVSHSGIPGMVDTWRWRQDVGPGARVSQLSSASFDSFVGELCVALLTGAVLVLPRARPVLGADLLRFLTDHRVTHAYVTPSQWTGLPSELPPTLRVVGFGGEVLPASLLDRVARDRMKVFNDYGPTETTVNATMSRPLTAGMTPPIGTPITGRSVYLLDDMLRPVVEGEAGELYIGGAAVARGYLGRPGLTADRFVADPFASPGSRMYRTGDRARLRPDGQLDFLGRSDDQLSVRGYRIEPQGIVAAITATPGVATAAVVLREDRPGDQRLVAYVVPIGPEPVSIRQLRSALARSLARHEIPSTFVVVPELPTTVGGKLDRQALVEMDPLVDGVLP